MRTSYLFLCLALAVVVGAGAFLGYKSESLIKDFRGNECGVREKDIFVLNGKRVLDDNDLRKSRESLNNKLIRLETTYWTGGVHGPVLASVHLPLGSDDPTIAVEFSPDRDKDYIYFIETLNSGVTDVQLIGYFTYIASPSAASDSNWDNSPYRFHVICTEKAGRVRERSEAADTQK